MRCADSKSLISHSLGSDARFAINGEERPMTPEELPDHCLYFHWGSFRFSLCGRGPMLAWGVALIALCTGVGIYKLLALI
jgi:hypothetical protein